MTKTDLTLVFESADDENFEVPCYPDNNSECWGISYWTEKRPVTLVGAVAIVRWQSMQLNGKWDCVELQATLILLQKKAILLSSKSPKMSNEFITKCLKIRVNPKYNFSGVFAI